MAIDLKTSRDQRVAKARALVDAGSFVRSAGAVMIFSDCPTVVGGGWTVVADSCTCPDATLGQAARLLSGRCKHVVAAEFVELLAERDVARAAIAEIRALTVLPFGSSGEEEDDVDSIFKPEQPRLLTPVAFEDLEQHKRDAAKVRLAQLAQEMDR